MRGDECIKTWVPQSSDFCLLGNLMFVCCILGNVVVCLFVRLFVSLFLVFACSVLVFGIVEVCFLIFLDFGNHGHIV